jgi:DNA (cytosine-5)-methyltransferase 1
MSHKSSKPILIDLFCGAGGLSQGLSYAGFDARVGIDFDQNAIATYSANHRNSKAILADISTISGAELQSLTGTRDIDLVAGGPSCQGYSTHGKRVEDDSRNFLFKEFVRLVEDIQPKFFLMENVKGLLTYSKGHFKTLIEEDFARIGYRVVSKTLCAADYGVPQMRHRVMFVGTRLPNVDLSFPKPTHGEQTSHDSSSDLLPYVTVNDAIGDLPLMNGDFNKQIWEYATETKSKFQKYVRASGGNGVTLHNSKALSEQAGLLASFIGQGQGLRAVPVKYLPDRFKKMRRIRNGQLRRDCTTLYHRLDPKRPAYTITCYYRNVASGPFLHPWEDRSLSHREAARLMSFPDHYEFRGTGIPRQIGNAVPPLMAAAVGRHILGLLGANKAAEYRRAA